MPKHVRNCLKSLFIRAVKDLFGEPVQLLPDGKTVRLSSKVPQTWLLSFD